MNEDLYDNGSAVVGLFRLFTNFLKFPGESVDPLGGVGVLGITGPSPSCPSFFTLLSIKNIRDGGTIPEIGKKHLITLSAHNFFL